MGLTGAGRVKARDIPTGPLRIYRLQNRCTGWIQILFKSCDKAIFHLDHTAGRHLERLAIGEGGLNNMLLQPTVMKKLAPHKPVLPDRQLSVHPSQQLQIFVNRLFAFIKIMPDPGIGGIERPRLIDIASLQTGQETIRKSVNVLSFGHKNPL
jgi:hypothetical protein